MEFTNLLSSISGFAERTFSDGKGAPAEGP